MGRVAGQIALHPPGDPPHDGEGEDDREDQYDSILLQVVDRLVRGPAPLAEHGPQEGARLREGIGPEEDPAEVHHQQGIGPLERGGPAQAQMAELLRHQQHEIEEPPAEEGPVGPVPDAGEEPDQEEVAHGLPGPGPAAPQGDVHIVPEPGAQGDMPPPPELGDRAGDIGEVEVLQEMETEHPPQADGHVRVAGEVVVDLKGIAQGAQPGHGGRELSAGHAPGGVGHGGQLVGEEDLFPQPHHEAAAPGGEIPPVLPAVEDLIGHGGVFHDGPRHQLGEEGDVEPQPQGIALDLCLAHSNVEDVAHGLEGEEGDADGQLDHRDGHIEPHQRQVLQGEGQVFEHKKKAQVAHHGDGDGKGGTFPLHPPEVDPQAEAVVGQDGDAHDQDEPGLAPGIEEQGGRQQPQVLGPPHAPEHHIVAQQHHRQEGEEENGTGEEHGGTPYKYEK